MAVKEKIRIRLKGFDYQLVDSSAAKIVEVVTRTGARVSGPIPLPTEKEIVTILRAVHKYKDSREQFEMRTHKRLIDVLRPTQKTVEALKGLELPAGVEIEVKDGKSRCSGTFRREKMLVCKGNVDSRRCQPITNRRYIPCKNAS